MENLDGTVLATALPAMAADLHEDPVALKLALTSYLLALAVFIPPSGWVADKFGARKVFRAAMMVFTLGSILCGLSTSLTGVVLARVVQGAGGAMMAPVGRLVIVRMAPRSELVSALAWLTIPALIGPMMGPPVGGFIATYFHWRYIFWINVPIGVIGVLLAGRCIPDLHEENPGPLDAGGAAILGLGLSCLVFGFSIAGRGFAPPAVADALVIVGALALLAYARHAQGLAHPILDLSLLKIPTFRAAVVGGFLFRIGAGATPFLLPLLLQVGFHLTAFQSGLLTFVSAAGAMVMKTTAQPILRLFGFRRVLICNALLSCAFLTLYALFTQATPHWLILATLLVGGFFRSLEFTALNALGYAEIDRPVMSRATSFAAVSKQLSGSVGVAVGAAALELARAAHGGGALSAGDFPPAFFTVAGVATLSVLLFWPLRPTDGDDLAGRSAHSVAAAESRGEI